MPDESNMRVILPRVYAIDEVVARNSIRQMAEPSEVRTGRLPAFVSGRTRGLLFQPDDGGEETVVVPSRKAVDRPRVLQAKVDPTAETNDLTDARWLRHPAMTSPLREDRARAIADVLSSWAGAFSFSRELAPGEIGLRPPQLGAVHAAQAHWTVSDETATVVMPTGTGKTETMISLLVSMQCSKLLVIVPTDALRAQLSEKFLTLGILKSAGSRILAGTAKYPIVCTLEHIPSVEQADRILGSSQVIVTTSSIAGQCEDAVQERFAEVCPYLFIDEAHHAEARTWSYFKSKFAENRILQFTATPFREDGRQLDGKIIFKYPLKRAQAEGYFQPIHFEPVVEFDRARADAAIAQKAIASLRRDWDKGHIVMARVDSVARAPEVLQLYAAEADLNAVQIHTGIKSARAREEIRAKILSGEARVVVCVDMLGEGFDLPELKIAAFHDIRKSLAVTLQLAGRFTRSRTDLGDATFIANTADASVQDELRKLYSRDPDWNVLLPELSEALIGEEISVQQFLGGFMPFADEIPLRTIRPAISTVVYRTRCADWNPTNFRVGISAIDSCLQVHHTINPAERTLIIVTARRMDLEWTDVESLFSWQWELIVVFWSAEQELLFIHSSTNAGEYRTLAKAIAGEDAALIRGQNVFRTFHGVNRLRLQNVGLTEQLGRNIRYTGRMGADIGPELHEIQRGRAQKTVLAGAGYLDGKKLGLGASRKGRIWSHRRDRLSQFIEWCKQIGDKLLDETIDPDEVLKGTLEPKAIGERPRRMPIAVDWPDEFLESLDGVWHVVIGERAYPTSSLSLELVAPSLDGELRFAICSEDQRAEFLLEIFETDGQLNYRIVLASAEAVLIRRGERSEAKGASEFFYDEPPIIWFSDGSSLEGNDFVELKAIPALFERERIAAWTWDVNIQKESQGDEKDSDSIQARVIRDLLGRDYEIVIDDDGSGEVADVVCIRRVGDPAKPTTIEVDFYHCKYSGSPNPGGRIGDLYEVCGQAQKSISWMASGPKRTDLFTRLMRRTSTRLHAGRGDKFERGNGDLLQVIREMSHVCNVALAVHIVQPGLSRQGASRDQLQLLAVTESYLNETYRLKFGVIGSP